MAREVVVSAIGEAANREVRALAKGAGVRQADLSARLGSLLSATLDVDKTTSPATIRERVTEWALKVAEQMPPETRTALLVALALEPETAHRRSLHERVVWLAGRMHLSERTARRRVDTAMNLLAQTLIAESSNAEAGDPASAWKVERFMALLRLDVDGPELYEERQIEIVDGALDEIVNRFSLPSTGKRLPEGDPVVEALFGARLTTLVQETESHYRFRLSLPRRFNVGERHEYGIRIKLPVGRTIRPHYVLQPLNPCKAFVLRVRFDLAQMPDVVWLLEGVPPRVIDEVGPGDEVIAVSSTGDVRAEFVDLRPGYAYGVGWSWPGRNPK